MRTTVRLSDSLLREAKKYAAHHGTTLTSMLDQGLRMILRENAPAYKAGKKKFRLTTFKGTGLRPGIDPASNAAMVDIADGLNVPG